MSFLKKSIMDFPSVSVCRSLAVTKRSCRFLVLLKAVMGGFGNMIFSFECSLTVVQCFHGFMLLPWI